MKQIFSKNLIILLSLVIASCSANKRQSSEPQIRIVSLQGKPGKILTKVPSLNIPALRQQGKLANAQRFSQNISANSNDHFNAGRQAPQPGGQSQYAKASSDIIRDTLQFSQNPQNRPQTAGQKVVYQNIKKEKKIAEYNLANLDEEIEIEVIDKTKTPEKASRKVSKKKKYVTKKSKRKSKRSYKKKYFIQVGSFLHKSNANRSLKKMKKFHRGKIQTVSGKKVVHRVILGPFSRKSDARKLLKKVKNSGHDAVLIKNK